MNDSDQTMGHEKYNNSKNNETDILKIQEKYKLLERDKDIKNENIKDWLLIFKNHEVLYHLLTDIQKIIIEYLPWFYGLYNYFLILIGIILKFYLKVSY